MKITQIYRNERIDGSMIEQRLEPKCLTGLTANQAYDCLMALATAASWSNIGSDLSFADFNQTDNDWHPWRDGEPDAYSLDPGVRRWVMALHDDRAEMIEWRVQGEAGELSLFDDVYATAKARSNSVYVVSYIDMGTFESIDSACVRAHSTFEAAVADANERRGDKAALEFEVFDYVEPPELGIWQAIDREYDHMVQITWLTIV
jgi:hypothetical protein